jgi:hypothetical protein
LRLPVEIGKRLFAGVRIMHESSTYQAILEEGEVRALQKALLRVGQKRFGPAQETVQNDIKGIQEIPRLERMTEKLLVASSWRELLETT